MTKPIKFLIALALAVVTGFALLHTGLARKAFFELFAYVKGVEVLAPTMVREFPTDSPYEAWLVKVKTEIPVLEGMIADDIGHIALQPWPALGTGVTGLYLRFADYQITDGRVIEIPARGNTISEHHLYEQAVYLLSGSGYTLLQQGGEQEQRVEWKQGDLFSVPLNVRYTHYSTGNEPARMLVVTSFPLMLNVLGSEEFIETSSFAFTDRYDGAKEYFEPHDHHGELVEITNFADDIRHVEAPPFDYRGQGNKSIRWLMAGNSMLSMHISEMPPKMYKKAHRHSGDAFILFLSGEGFSLTWPEGQYDKRVRLDWRPGTLFVPPIYWYHQHLNAGSTPARYLAINAPTFVRNIGLRFIDQLEVDVEEVRQEWKKAIEQAAREGK